jgi:chromosome segregation ATPase
VEEAFPQSTSYALTNLSDDDIEIFIRARSISPEVEKALRLVLSKKNSVGNIDRQIHSREDQQKTIAEDQARLRENLKALKGSAEERELVQRYTHQLNAQEDTLDRVKRELVDLRSQHDVAQSDLKKTIDELSLDATL